MEPSQLKYVLEELHFSAALPPEVQDQLAGAITMMQPAAGTVLFREGSKNNNLYLVRKGRVALEMNVPGRGSVRILTIGPGEMLGWSAVLRDGNMTAAAVVVEDSELLSAPASKLLELCEANRSFGFHLMQRMAHALAHRLVATRLQLLDLFADAEPEMSSRNRSEGEA